MMDDDPEVIRQQVEETKVQLVEKLESLEQKVHETVQTAGSVVNSTVEKVQDTVESVTGAVHDTVKSVGGAFDVRAHMNAHPWLVMGGAAAFGFLMARHFSRQPKTVPVTVTGWPQEISGQQVQPEVVAAAVKAAYESGRRVTSPWRQVQLMAIGALSGMVQDIASRAASEIWQRVGDRFGVSPESSSVAEDDAHLQIHRSEGAMDKPWSRRQQS